MYIYIYKHLTWRWRIDFNTIYNDPLSIMYISFALSLMNFYDLKMCL